MKERCKFVRPVAGRDDHAVRVGVPPAVLLRRGEGADQRGDHLLAVLVMTQAEAVERSEFLAQADHVDLDDGRPRVEGEFGSDVSRECLAALPVTGQCDDAELLQVHEVEAVVVLPNGDEQWVGRQHVAALGQSFAEGEAPVGACASPRSRKVCVLGEVQGHGALGEGR